MKTAGNCYDAVFPFFCNRKSYCRRTVPKRIGPVNIMIYALRERYRVPIRQRIRVIYTFAVPESFAIIKIDGINLRLISGKIESSILIRSVVLFCAFYTHAVNVQPSKTSRSPFSVFYSNTKLVLRRNAKSGIKIFVRCSDNRRRLIH